MKTNLVLVCLLCIPLFTHAGFLGHKFIDDSGTALHWAAANGNEDQLKSLISQGSPVDLRADQTEATPLHFAAWKGQYGAANLLIGLGADVNAKTYYGNTPLHYASGTRCETIGGHREVAALLLKHGADVNAETINDETALMATVGCSLVDIAQLLIDNGADVDARGNQYTTLEMAASRSPSIAMLLIDRGASVNTRDRATRTTPLHAAAKGGNFDVVVKLLQHGAKVNVEDKWGNSPLSVAKDPGIVEAIAGTPLHWAAAVGDNSKVKKLLSEGYQVGLRTDMTEATALHFSARKGQFETAKLLVEQDSDVNAETYYEATPLHYASGMFTDCKINEGHRMIVTMLIEHGANVNNKDSTGKTALRYTVKCNAIGIARLLINHGADINDRDALYMKTPLHMAAWIGLRDFVEMLLLHGADANARDRDGKTPLDLTSNREVADTIKRHLEKSAQ